METKELQLSAEKSQELADNIASIKILLWGIDVDYAKLVVKAMKETAQRQDSIAALNPSYISEKSMLLDVQANMLESIAKFVELGKHADELRKSIRERQEVLDTISALFI